MRLMPATRYRKAPRNGDIRMTPTQAMAARTSFFCMAAWAATARLKTSVSRAARCGQYSRRNSVRTLMGSGPGRRVRIGGGRRPAGAGCLRRAGPAAQGFEPVRVGPAGGGELLVAGIRAPDAAADAGHGL